MTSSIYNERISSLRREIVRANLDGFIVPRTDEYQNERIPPCAERVAFLTGFTGSAATVIVLSDRAAFFTDGRYTLQAKQQVSSALFEIFDTDALTPLQWLEANVRKGARVAYDPWLHSEEAIERIRMSLATAEAEASPVARNFVDIIWDDKPDPIIAPVYPHDVVFSGVSSYQKRQEVAAFLKKKNASAVILSDPASVAWVLNIRGCDMLHTPLPLSRAVIHDDGKAEWLVDSRKVTEAVISHLGPDVGILPIEDFPSCLGRLAKSGKTILLDPSRTPGWVVDHLKSAHGKIELDQDPCALARAIKNPAELVGARAAHVRDGAALTSFLAWLDNNWERQPLTELDVEQKLSAFREGGIHYRGPSFDTIAGTGEHGAIVHYRATPETNATLISGQLFLLDSGAQYLDGTTDVTRTVILGKPTNEMRECFTRVLKGLIALSLIRFPEGTTGADLDALARQHLWAAGLDYAHGTGHGIGSYLDVHEGPHGLSKRNKTPLAPGMLLSNEPGLYLDEQFGIRIENVVTVVTLDGPQKSRKRLFMFDTLTMAPIDRRLVMPSLMTKAEIAWLNAYHKRVMKTLSSWLDEPTSRWLKEATLDIEE